VRGRPSAVERRHVAFGAGDDIVGVCRGFSRRSCGIRRRARNSSNSSMSFERRDDRSGSEMMARARSIICIAGPVRRDGSWRLIYQPSRSPLSRNDARNVCPSPVRGSHSVETSQTESPNSQRATRRAGVLFAASGTLRTRRGCLAHLAPGALGAPEHEMVVGIDDEHGSSGPEPALPQGSSRTITSPGGNVRTIQLSTEATSRQ
jgi:hypothetical protein